MNKTATIRLYPIFLFLFFFSISQQACKKKEKEVVTDINAQLENYIDENDSDALLGEDEDTYDEAASDPEESMTETTNAEETMQEPDQQETAQNNTYDSRPPSSMTSSTSGGYMIIAGNYLVESNAQSMVNKLHSAGYTAAEYAVFDLSQYRTVIAGRYSSRSEANNVSSQLKASGFDNYVLKAKN